MATSTVEFQELINEFGDFCLEVAPSLRQQMVYSSLQSVRQLGIELVTGIRDEMQVGTIFTKSVLQKGKQSTWNPVYGAVDFKPRKWKMRPWQVDLSFDMQSFNATFLQHYKSASRQSSASVPLVEFMLSMLLEQLTEDMETAIWLGQYDAGAPAANEAEPLKVVNGILRNILDLVDDGEIGTTVTTGVIDASTAVEAFNDMYNALTNKTKAAPSRIRCSYKSALFFIENYTALTGENNIVISSVMEMWRRAEGDISKISYLPLIPLPLSGGTCLITPVWGMGESTVLIAESLIKGGVIKVGMGDENDIMGLDSQKNRRDLEIMMDGSISTQIMPTEINGEVFLAVNDRIID